MNAQIIPVDTGLPPFDDAAERAYLSSAVHGANSIRETPFLRADHFFHGRHRYIFEAIAELEAAALGVDRPAIEGKLRDMGRLEQIGGPAYLAELYEHTPALIAKHFVQHARRIETKARRRKLAEAARSVLARCYHDEADDVLEDAPELLEQAARGTETASKREPATPATVLEAMQTRAVVHVSTGIEELDARTSGGPRFCDLVALLGAPDAGKTTIAVAIADHCAAEGRIVGFCCFDDDEEDLATRLAQRRNWTRAEVESREDFAELARSMPPIFVYDATWTLEAAIEDLAARAGDAGAVLIVDSLQTMNVAGASTAIGKSDAISIGLRVLRTTAKARRWLVVFTSEMVRGSYAGNGATQTAALASAKWSGDAEYASKLMLAVKSVADEPDLLHVEIAKSKLCAKGEFYLRLDRAHQRLEAAEAPDKPARAEAEASRTERELAEGAPKIVKIVLANPGIGTRVLRAKAKAAKLGGRDKVDALVEHCIDEGQIVDRPESHGSRIDHRYYVASAADPGAPT